MNHAISSVDFILQMKGYAHGAGGKPIDPPHSECSEYMRGWCGGRNAKRAYSEELCKKLGLVDAQIKVMV
jgi:hypothetical protein